MVEEEGGEGTDGGSPTSSSGRTGAAAAGKLGRLCFLLLRRLAGGWYRLGKAVPFPKEIAAALYDRGQLEPM